MSRFNDLNRKPDMDIEVFNSGPVVIIKMRNEPGRPVEYVSSNVGINLGYTEDFFYNGSLCYDTIIHPQDIKRVSDNVGEHLKNNRFYIHHKPYRIITLKGEIRWISEYTTVLRNDKGEVTGFLGYITDITKQLNKENFLNEVKDRYYHLINITEDGVWDWDLRTDEILFSNRWKEMLGYAEDEIIESIFEWEKRVHPDDIDKCHRGIQLHLDGENDIYECEYRVMHKNGDYLWILDRGIKILDDQGKPYRMIGTHRNITKEKEMKEMINTMAKEDSLTGLLNRNSFFDLMNYHLSEGKRYGYEMSFMVIDIDYFKKVNDTWGHAFGDTVIKTLADKLKSFIRESDLVFRLGGEEFGVLLSHTDLINAKIFAERLRKEVIEIRMYPEKNIQMSITISIGISSYCKGLTLDSFLKNSNKALYVAKTNGRNQVQTYIEE